MAPFGQGEDGLPLELGKALSGEQPDEWVYDSQGQPTCTAFIPERNQAELAHEREQERLAGQRRSLERQGQGKLFAATSRHRTDT